MPRDGAHGVKMKLGVEGGAHRGTTSLQSASQILATRNDDAQLPENLRRHAKTFCLSTGLEGLDKSLGLWKSPSSARVGLAPGSVLEVIGPKGSGKSSLAADIAARWALSAAEVDTNGAETQPLVYVINTEGALDCEKLVAAIEAQQVQVSAAEGSMQSLTVGVSPPRDACELAMKRIRYARCTSLVQFVAILRLFSSPHFDFDISRHPFPALIDNPTQCLIVVDSIAEFLRASCITDDQKKQRRTLMKLLGEFGNTTRTRGATAVVTNSMAFKLVKDSTSLRDGRRGVLVPQVNVIRDTQQDQGYLVGLQRRGSRQGSGDGAEIRKWESALGRDACRVLLRWSEYPACVR
ncbi:hypothetical protein K437DRAFT_180098 [Tilletiaria anomala UBC 951]|uniref:RecA family profile 1 domain-containing protein n=1 Tax=Tilletiaria anomala (strain ATCC 24038 / CBS 436.72 / UBC 951) TaxID=1037660 RepID=A0A066VRD6_TILAU|nr:uncharacterized protein K437DRAFT_180098 [Tilletiaria anomala UBC 951]KDN41155.1 hypothetical protein K437DRAFT_180098 [Tilletiaria anomala UBC 951]